MKTVMLENKQPIPIIEDNSDDIYDQLEDDVWITRKK
jgi:hypothetical protein